MSLPWHVVVRADRRAGLTALGVAIVVAFAAVGSAIPAALHTEAVSPEGQLADPDPIAAREDGARFDPTGLPSLRWGVAIAIVSNASGPIVAVTAVGPDAPAPARAEDALVAPESRWLPGRPVRLLDRERPLVARPAPEGFPLGANWVLVAPSVFLRLDPNWTEGTVDYALLGDVDAQTTSALEASGFAIARVPAADPFFAASAAEVARDLSLVVAYSSVLVGLFAYEFLRSEVWEKRAEIGLWRGLGLTKRGAFALLLGRCAMISAAGTLAGIGAAYLFVSAAGRMTSLDGLASGLRTGMVLVLVLAFLLAGVAGAAAAAFTASRITIREAMEGGL